MKGMKSVVRNSEQGFQYFTSLEIKHVWELKALISNTYPNMYYALLYYVILKYEPQNVNFKINILNFNLFMFYTCFDPEGSSSGRGLCIQLQCSTFYMHQYKQSCR